MTLLRTRDDTLESTSYPATSHHSELSLLQGYGAPVTPPVRVDRLVDPQPCVCGGLLDPGMASEIPAEVAHHNASQEHLAWRERMGIR